MSAVSLARLKQRGQSQEHVPLHVAQALPILAVPFQGDVPGIPHTQLLGLVLEAHGQAVVVQSGSSGSE